MQEPAPYLDDDKDAGHIIADTTQLDPHSPVPFLTCSEHKDTDDAAIQSLTAAEPELQTSSWGTDSMTSDVKTYKTQDKRLELPALVVDQLLYDQRVAECRASVPADTPCDCVVQVFHRGGVTEEATEKVSTRKRCPLRTRAAVWGASVVLGILAGHAARRQKKRS